jgi:hypothetical protein
MTIKKLIPPLAILAAVIIFCAILARVLLSGDTLAEYAEKNPDIAYGPSPEVVATPTPTPIPTPAPSPTATPEAKEEELLPFPLSEWTEPEGRVEYQPGFTKEPINDRLLAYISGVSFPILLADLPLEMQEEYHAWQAEMNDDPDSERNLLEEWGLPNIWENARDIKITRDDLSYLCILHYDFYGQVQLGEIICNVAVADDLLAIFYGLYESEYQLDKVRLIDEYGGDDRRSMTDNNTSCFNYRVAGSGNLSQHAYGLAIDINPFINPYIRYDYNGNVATLSPPGSDYYADRNRNFPHKIDQYDLCYRLFAEQGWYWGGEIWNTIKDYQHFQNKK